MLFLPFCFSALSKAGYYKAYDVKLILGVARVPDAIMMNVCICKCSILTGSLPQALC